MWPTEAWRQHRYKALGLRQSPVRVSLHQVRETKGARRKHLNFSSQLTSHPYRVSSNTKHQHTRACKMGNVAGRSNKQREQRQKGTAGRRDKQRATAEHDKQPIQEERGATEERDRQRIQERRDDRTTRQAGKTNRDSNSMDSRSRFRDRRRYTRGKSRMEATTTGGEAHTDKQNDRSSSSNSMQTTPLGDWL